MYRFPETGGPDLRETSLCPYFWRVVLGILLGISLMVSILIPVGIGLFAIAGLFYLLGIKHENDTPLSLRSFTFKNRKIYPFYIWLALAALGTGLWSILALGVQTTFVWTVLGLGAAMCLWVFWLSLGLRVERKPFKITMLYARLGKYRVYPFLIWASLAFLGVVYLIFAEWGELGLIVAIALPLSTLLLWGSLDHVKKCFAYMDAWVDDLFDRAWEIFKNRKMRRGEKKSSGTWLLVKSYLKAKTKRVCPTVTFSNSQPPSEYSE